MIRSQLYRLRGCFPVLVFVISVLFLNIQPAHAERSGLYWQVWTPYLTVYTVSSVAEGWDSSGYPGQIYLHRYICSGVIREHDKYPFTQSVIVQEGKLFEGSTNHRTFYHQHLTPFSVIIGPYDKAWGGEMFPDLFFGKGAINKSWFKIAVSRSTSPMVYRDEYNHVFYDNGWQNLL